MTSVSIPASRSVVVVSPSRSVTTGDVVERIGDRIHDRGDRWAVRHGLTVTRIGLTGRAYRSPAFDLLGGAR